MPTATELRELEDDELETRLEEYRREMLNLRFQLATGQLDNYSRFNVAKRNVARVLTVLRDREIALAEGRDASPVPATRPRRRPVEDVEVADEETPVRRPRKPRAQSVDETSDTVDDGEVEVADGDDVVDEEDE